MTKRVVRTAKKPEKPKNLRMRVTFDLTPHDLALMDKDMERDGHKGPFTRDAYLMWLMFAVQAQLLHVQDREENSG